ncbi:MAG: nucleoside deaminase, partial [Candidatus Pacebacteria bacterium]|nr:nucleoside deaminase [Candidatus Paceibacterota bacterium]
KEDEKYMRRCVQLSEKASEFGDNPFGCVIAGKDGIIVEARNKIKENDITNHAEILAMREAQKLLKTSVLSEYTIYSNCEPCPMCAFMMRELKFKRVVFALLSPQMGGYSKWNILEDKELVKFKPFFSNPPEVVTGILKEEAEAVFKKVGWKMCK